MGGHFWRRTGAGWLGAINLCSLGGEADILVQELQHVTKLVELGFALLGGQKGL